ncbi:MAG: carbohydrate ABC transporter permease [Treponemataceae bacterium]|nr:carbohydrate ABC transporter permease [Treponemataceae bacterium]
MSDVIYNSKKQKRLSVGEVINMTIIGLLSATCILPFINILAKSISSNTAVLSKKVYFLPKQITFQAYASIFKDGQLTWSMLYSVIMTATFTFIGMLLTICAAYPLTRKRLKGRSVITFLLMFTMYFSAGLIPEYLLMKDLNLLDSFWVLVLPLAFSPYNMLIMKTFFLSTIPDSLEESAFLDGATDFQTLLKIILPLSTPIIATLSLFYAVGRWNAYADAQYYITTKSLQPIQYLLRNMVLSSASDAITLSEGMATQSTPEVLQSAMVMFATLPILCIYPFVQKYFVKGIMIGAVKG